MGRSKSVPSLARMMRRRVAVVTALFLSAGLAGCLSGAHVPACAGNPVDHDGIRFAWPPHMATDLAPLASADCLALRTDVQMDLIVVDGETDVSITHLGDGTLRIKTEPTGPARGMFVATYEEAYNDGACSSSRPSNQPNATWTTTCADPRLSHLEIDWRDRPNALLVDGRVVRWVLAPGLLAAGDDPVATAHALLDGLGIARFTSTTTESPVTWQERLASRDTAMDDVRISCDNCTSISMWPPDEPRAYGEQIEWVVDPNGDVAWVVAGTRLAWEVMAALSLEDRDRHIEALAEAQGMYLMHEPSKAMILEGPPWHLYWKVDFRYHDDDPDDGRGRIAIMQLDGVTGNWTAELDGEFIEADSAAQANQTEG